MPAERLEMERKLEFEGKDVEEALEKARQNLGRRPEEFEYEIVEDAKRGFLGIGTRPARIRLREAAVPSGGAPPPEAVPYSHYEALREVAGRILREMKLDLTARVREREETIVLELGGRDARLFLEHDGEPLDALQHILNKILSRDARFGVRIVADCQGFRSRRDRELVERATRAADEVQRTGKPVHLDGLNPYERRLVHVTLAGEKGVRTYSSGDGTRKRLTIEALEPSAPAGEA